MAIKASMGLSLWGLSFPMRRGFTGTHQSAIRIIDFGCIWRVRKEVAAWLSAGRACQVCSTYLGISWSLLWLKGWLHCVRERANICATHYIIDSDLLPPNLVEDYCDLLRNNLSSNRWCLSCKDEQYVQD